MLSQTKPEFTVPRRPTAPPAIVRYPKAPQLFELRMHDGRKQLSDVAMDAWLRALVHAMAADGDDADAAIGGAATVVERRPGGAATLAVPLSAIPAAELLAPLLDDASAGADSDPHGLRRLRRFKRVRATPAAPADGHVAALITPTQVTEAVHAVLPDRKPPASEAAVRLQAQLEEACRRDPGMAARTVAAFCERLAAYAKTIQGALLRSAYPPSWLLGVVEQLLDVAGRLGLDGAQSPTWPPEPLLPWACAQIAQVGPAWERLGARILLLDQAHRLCVGDAVAGPVRALDAVAAAYQRWTEEYEAAAAAAASPTPTVLSPTAGSTGPGDRIKTLAMFLQQQRAFARVDALVAMQLILAGLSPLTLQPLPAAGMVRPRLAAARAKPACAASY